MGASNHSDKDRQQHDYYATEPRAMELLLAEEHFAPVIWECACGEGHLSRVLEQHGFEVISTDLIYRGFGDPEPLDFLKETLAPSGYNTLAEPIKVVISANTNNGQNGFGKTTELTTIDVTVDNGSAKGGTVATGTVSITVENNRGTTLPGTGGIGTTIFYVVGGGLMVAAAILLITKKRMENR